MTASNAVRHSTLQISATARFTELLPRQAECDEFRGMLSVSDTDHQILTAVLHVRDGRPGGTRSKLDFPEHLTRILRECPENVTAPTLRHRDHVGRPLADEKKGLGE